MSFEHEDYDQLATTLGMPPGAHWVRVATVAPIDRSHPFTVLEILAPPFAPTPWVWHTALVKHWHGYSFDLFGMVVRESHEPLRWPLLRLIGQGDLPDLVIQLWRQRAIYKDAELYAQLDWRPGDSLRGRDSTQGQATEHAAMQRRSASRGRTLLQQISTGRSWESPDDARARLLDAAHKLIHKYKAIDRPNLMTPLGLSSTDGVADVLSRAQWKISELKAAVEKTHAGCSRGA